MTVPSRPFILLVALLVASSGCLGGSKASKSDPDASESEAAAATNTLSGFVVTADELPVAEASVSVDGVDDVRITNQLGEYRFVDLPPGERMVRAEKAGYRTGLGRASIRDGYSTVVNVTLEEAPPEAFHETVPFNGHLSCHATVGDDPETSTRHDCNEADPNANPSHDFAVKAGAAQIQIEFFWTQTTAAARNLTLRVETVDWGALNVVFAYYPASSGAKVVVGEANLRKYFPNGGPMRVSMASAGSVRVDPVPVGAGVAFQQPFEVDFTVFYGESGSPGYSYRST